MKKHTNSSELANGWLSGRQSVYHIHHPKEPGKYWDMIFTWSMLKFSGKNIAYVKLLKLPVNICVLEKKKKQPEHVFFPQLKISDIDHPLVLMHLKGERSFPPTVERPTSEWLITRSRRQTWISWHFPSVFNPHLQVLLCFGGRQSPCTFHNNGDTLWCSHWMEHTCAQGFSKFPWKSSTR